MTHDGMQLSFLKIDRFQKLQLMAKYRWHETPKRSSEKLHTPLTCSFSGQGYLEGILKFLSFLLAYNAKAPSISMLSGHTLQAHNWHNKYFGILHLKITTFSSIYI